MWEDDDVDSGADRFFSRNLSDAMDSLFDLGRKALRPLFRVEVDGEWVTVAFDLPGAKKEDVEVSCTEDTISVDARIEPVSLRVSANKNSPLLFERYTRSLRLPVRVDPTGGSAKYRNGMIVVKLPVARGGKAVKIQGR